MSDQPKVLISAFADEAANSKTAAEQLAVISALGLRYYSLRFIDVGGGIKNVMDLAESEIDKVNRLNREYDLSVASIGSPIGKVKLVDKEDGSTNLYVPFDQYLEKNVMRAITLAHQFDTKLIRGFSFYPPRGEDSEPYFNQTIDQIGAIAARCAEHGVVFGLELEANLIGSSGIALARIYDELSAPALVLIYDGGNLSSQNLHAKRCLEEFHRMRHGLGWMHIKDYHIDPDLDWQGYVDEERLKNFVPCDVGDSGHADILRDLSSQLDRLSDKMVALGAPGFFLELEPHLRGGGQFGGFSGPDGMGIAIRALCKLLDYVSIDYELRTFDRMKRFE